MTIPAGEGAVRYRLQWPYAPSEARAPFIPKVHTHGGCLRRELSIDGGTVDGTVSRRHDRADPREVDRVARFYALEVTETRLSHLGDSELLLPYLDLAGRSGRPTWFDITHVAQRRGQHLIT